MPLIPNYIARLRTHSQSTAASSSSHSGSHSNSTAGPSTPGSELIRLAADPPVEEPENKDDQTPRSNVARKIHPNLSALLDEDVLPETAAEDLGPRPPRGRSRSAEQLARMRPDEVSQRSADTQDRQDIESAALPSPPPRSPLLSRILSVPLLSGVMPALPSDADVQPDSSETTYWSTFGRRRPLVSTIGEFGSLHRRGSGSKSSAHSKSSRHRHQRSAPTTPSTTRPPSSSARTSTPSHAQATETIPSPLNSPAGTVSSSSKSHSQSGHSHSVRSRRPPLVHPEPIPDELDTPLHPQTPARVPFHLSSFTPSPDMTSPLAARPTLDDSPHTFGRATPKDSGPSSRAYPKLGGTFAGSSSNTPPQQHTKPVGHDPSATFPPRKRTRSRPATGSLVSFPSLPLKPSVSRIRAQDVFQASDHRRLSANWSAEEAVKDGSGQQGETWPATVSREMVRLSLVGHRSVMGGEEELAVNEVGTLPPGHLKNATRFGSTGEDRRRFMWAGRRRPNTDTVAPSQSSSSAPPQSTLQPAFSVSSPSGSGSTPDTAAEPREGLLAPYVSVTAPTPSPSPSGSRFGTLSEPTLRPHSDNNLPPSHSQGKRKIIDAEDDESPGLAKKSLLSGSRGSASNRASDASHAPSSFRQTKRIRLSTPSHSPEQLSRSLSSQSPHLSPPASPRSRPPSSLRTLPTNPRTVSQSSIPLRAIVSPRPPSIDRRSTYHMRDPALPPPRRQSTQWAGSARISQEEGRRAFPLQGWAFVLGFVLFPMWWVAALAPVGWGWGWRAHTRRVQDGKGAWVREELEARQVWEYDVAFTWRRRCRLMSILGLLVYIPLIVLLAVLIPRT